MHVWVRVPSLVLNKLINMEYLTMFLLVVLQNASFTWVSRARNSGSMLHHGVAAVFSNGIWLLVIRQVVYNFNNYGILFTYLVAAVTGSILMHYLSMNYFEKWVVKKYKRRDCERSPKFGIRVLNGCTIFFLVRWNVFIFANEGVYNGWPQAVSC